MSPSGDVHRYVGIVGYVEGCSKERADVNLLSTAPGKQTLHAFNGTFVKRLDQSYPAAPGF